MNEKEKKAIEELSKKAVFCNYEERDYPNMICFKKDMLIVLNLIEKLQKENEILKEEKEQGWEEWNNLEQGSYEIEQKLKKQIKELQKENKELKEENEYNKLLLELNNNFTIDKKTGNYKWNVIEIQKIKDKIEELNKAYEDSKDENGESEYYYPDYTIRVLEELLESE